MFLAMLLAYFFWKVFPIPFFAYFCFVFALVVDGGRYPRSRLACLTGPLSRQTNLTFTTVNTGPDRPPSRTRLVTFPGAGKSWLPETCLLEPRLNCRHLLRRSEHIFSLLVQFREYVFTSDSLSTGSWSNDIITSLHFVFSVRYIFQCL